MCFIEEGGDQKPRINQKIFTDEEIANIVDMVLKEDDLNGDGLVNFCNTPSVFILTSLFFSFGVILRSANNFLVLAFAVLAFHYFTRVP